MCGICGIINFNGEKATKDQLQKMTNGMVHRGPDDEGIFISNNIGLGMRRLSIIDLETGHQPISNEDKSIWTIMNGEIYNHIELRKELIKKGHIFKTNSDTEVIVHLYEEYGYNLLEKINGMFALAILDKKKDLLLVVRDRLGVKPLFFSVTKDKFIFSSDLKSISKNSNVNIDSLNLIKYFGLAYIPTPQTIFSGIEKLPPAHYLVIKNNKIIKKRYWKLPNKNNWTGNLDNAKEEFLELINSSIKLRFRSDVPLGLFLSGGLDSSGLVALASKLGYEELNTFTIDFIGKNGNDNLFANIVSSQYNTNHNLIEFDLVDFKKELDELIPYLDEPISDSAIVPTFVLSKIARDQGIKVLLSGAGGDEIFGGYSRHYRPKYFSPRWIAENFPYPLRKATRFILENIQPQRAMRTISPEVAYGLECSGSDLSFFSQIIKDKKMIESILGSITETFTEIHNNVNENYSKNRMRLDVKNYLLDDILSLTDKSTMAASVEGRVPFLDHRLVEFAFLIPNELNQVFSKPKGLFIESIKDILPKELINRKKEGFNAPTSSWMNTSAGLNIKNEILDSLNPVLKEIINTDLLEKSLKKNSKTSGHSIFGLYVMNRWLNINKS